MHSDYHKPSDTWEKINADDAVKLLGEIDEIALTLADAADRPVFARAQPPDVLNGEIPKGSVTSGYGPYFGSIPDFGGPAKGVRFSEYRPMGTAVIAICDRFRPRLMDMLAHRPKLARFRFPLVALSLFCPLAGFCMALPQQPKQSLSDSIDLGRVVIVGIFSAVGVVLALFGGMVGAMSQPGGAFKIAVFVNLACPAIAILALIVLPILRMHSLH